MRTSQTPLLAPPAAPLVLSPRFSPFRAAPLSPRLQLPLSTWPGVSPVGCPPSRIALPLTITVWIPSDSRISRACCAGRSRTNAQRPGATGRVAGRQIAAVAETEHFVRMARDSGDSFLDAQYRCLADPMRQQVAGKISV